MRPLLAASLLLAAAPPARAGGAACTIGHYQIAAAACHSPEELETKAKPGSRCALGLYDLSGACKKAYEKARRGLRSAKTRDELERSRNSLEVLDRTLDMMPPLRSSELSHYFAALPGSKGNLRFNVVPNLPGLREEAEREYRRKLSSLRAGAAKKDAAAPGEAPSEDGERKSAVGAGGAPGADSPPDLAAGPDAASSIVGLDEAAPEADPAAKEAELRGLREQETFVGALAPEDPAVLSQVGASYLRAGSPADSERVLDKALAAAPADTEALSQRAAARALQGKLDEAVADAKAVLEKEPRNATARRVLTYASLARDKVEFKARLGQPGFGAPPSADGTAGLSAAGLGGAAGAGRGASASRAAGADAARATPEVLTGGPGPGSELLQAAARKLALGDLSGALFEASRAVLAAPGDARGWALRARISNRLKNHRAALRDAEEALRLDPANAAALLERGYARLQLGDYASALEDFEKALALEPRNAMGRLYRAMALEKLGRVEEAVRDYQAAAALDPALEPLVAEALARLRPGPGGPSAPARPARALLWSLTGVLAAALVLVGIKRVFRPGWRTTLPPAAAQDPGPAPEGSLGTLGPGAVLAGNFRIEAELARGGMGVVYQGTDLTLRRPVAVKQMRREAWESAEARERFLREARLAARLKHPNLAQILSVVSEGELLLVFELVEGETLERHLARRGRLGLHEAAGLLRDIGSAVDYAHAQKVIHRDLKPANVMLCRDGGLKVMDFGIAHESRDAAGLTQTAAWGTPPYMAPEAELGRVGRASDLYALGLIAYELLTGRRAFEGSAMHDRKRRGEFVPATALEASLPAAADAFFRRALDPEPERRFASAGELHAALSRLS